MNKLLKEIIKEFFSTLGVMFISIFAAVIALVILIISMTHELFGIILCTILLLGLMVYLSYKDAKRKLGSKDMKYKTEYLLVVFALSTALLLCLMSEYAFLNYSGVIVLILLLWFIFSKNRSLVMINGNRRHRN